MPTDTKPTLSALKKDAPLPTVLTDEEKEDLQSYVAQKVEWEAPKTKVISNPVLEAHEVHLFPSEEVKLAIYGAASQIYLKQRPDIAQGAVPKPPADQNDAKAAEAYSKAVESHLRTAQYYGCMEAKALWTNLFGETFSSPVDQKGGQS